MSIEPNTTELAPPVGLAELATLTDEQLAAREAAIIRAAEAKKRLVKAAMTLLYPTDFVSLGGKLYLQGEGAMRLAGVGVKLSEPVYQVEKFGDDYFVECMVEAEWGACGQCICETGTCNTRDKFWNADSERSEINQIRERAEGNEALARRMLLGHIKKKAYMNAVSRAVTGVMGIRGLTNEELASIGFTPDKAAAKIDYKSKKTAKKSTGAVETVDVAALLKLAVGSAVNVRGTIAEPAVIGAKSTRFSLSWSGGSQVIFCRGTDPVSDWVVSGAEAFFPDCEVGEYQGKTTYWASHPQEVTEGGGGDD